MLGSRFVDGLPEGGIHGMGFDRLAGADRRFDRSSHCPGSNGVLFARALAQRAQRSSKVLAKCDAERAEWTTIPRWRARTPDHCQDSV